MSRAAAAAPPDLDHHLRRLAGSEPAIWTGAPDPATIRSSYQQLRAGPLHGWTLSVKDNIDVAGSPTTAAIPSRQELADQSAPVVERLVGAGALFVGKANLDQLATGLVGTRSPYGTPTNPLDPTLVPGGSSSGSAVGVALGLVDVSLATDTAGSGRVPPACCGVVGLKPAPGVLPLDGVLPASPSFDCVSVVTRTVAEALIVGGVLGAGFPRTPTARRLVVGVPDEAGRAEASPAGRRALAGSEGSLRADGHEVVAVDLTTCFAAGDLLYRGPWLAERTASIGPLLAAAGRDAVAVVQEVVDGGRRWSGVEVFDAIAELDRLRRASSSLWEQVDVLVVPSVPDVPTLAQVAADPLGVNERMGRFTTFGNLLGLAAITVPGGRRDDGTPWSTTVLAPRGREAALVRVALDLELEP